MAGGHHDHHRLRLVPRDQVVHDEPGSAHRRPGVVTIHRAMQQIEHRISVGAVLVTGRRVNVHPPVPAQRGGVISDRCHGAVRHPLRVHEIRAGNIHQAPRVGIRLAHRRVVRIHHPHAVHHEGVPVCARIDRPDSRFPNAVVALGERRGRVFQPEHVAGGQCDALRLRSQDSKDDVPVRRDLRRNHRRALRPHRARRRRRRRGRGSILGQSDRSEQRACQQHCREKCKGVLLSRHKCM